eukprot:356628_1
MSGYSSKSFKTKLAPIIPEETEIDPLVVDNTSTTNDKEINNIICFVIVLALIDIFVIPIVALVLGFETLIMFGEGDEYATCTDAEYNCICTTLHDSNSNDTCSRTHDNWYTGIHVFSVMFCFMYEGCVLVIQMVIFIYAILQKEDSIKTAMGIRGKLPHFNLVNFIARSIQFIWILIMVMTYKEMHSCHCGEESEASVEYNSIFYQRRDLHAYLEVLMIFITIYLISTKVLPCCLRNRNINDNVWLQLYVTNTKRLKSSIAWSES